MKNLTNNCRTCKWFESSHEECRRHAPQVTIVVLPGPPTLQSRGQPTINPTPIAAFPSIGSPDHLWCGDWETKFEVIQ